jgi:hypothetical protein
MKFIVEAIARDLKKTKNSNKYYSGVKLSDGRWVNVMADCRELKKGDAIYITEPKTLGDGKQLWAFLDDVDKSPPVEPPQPSRFDPVPPPVTGTCCTGGKTLQDWARFVQDAWAVAKGLEPDDSQARAALINTAVIAWARGDISSVKCCTDLGGEEPF